MRRFYVFGILGVLIMGAAGGYYQYAAEKLDAISKIPLLPAIPLGTFPLILGDWNGREVPISETVLKVAGNDDHLSRFYVNSKVQAGATLYVGFTAEPRRMLGHRPDVCYVGSGWVLDETQKEVIRTADGNDVECLVHRFYRPGLAFEEVFVLNYYILNGVLTTDHKSFDGLRWRRPKQSGGRLEYVAQIQISSSSRQAVRLLAQEIAGPIMEYMP